MHRRLVVARARILLFASRYQPAWLAGTAALSLAKILENMEIGHNVMHGQWDWMNDPQIHSSTWDWDSASTAEAWKHSHNYVHHTYTNIRGKDHDLGYEIMRIDPHQKWHPVYLAQPFYNLVLAAFFEWGVALHDLDFEAIRRGEKSKEQVARELKGMARQGAHADRQGLHRVPGAQRRRKGFKRTLKANFTANVVRNVWAYAIIFCGHFPDQTYTFTEEEVDDETRGGLVRPPAARRREHRGQPALPRRSAATSATRSSTTSTRTCRARATPRSRRACKDDLRALRAAVQHRARSASSRHGAAHDPAARVPRRQAAAEARPVPRRRRRGCRAARGARAGGLRPAARPRSVRLAQPAEAGAGLVDRDDADEASVGVEHGDALGGRSEGEVAGVRRGGVVADRRALARARVRGSVLVGRARLGQVLRRHGRDVAAVLVEQRREAATRAGGEVGAHLGERDGRRQRGQPRVDDRRGRAALDVADVVGVACRS